MWVFFKWEVRKKRSSDPYIRQINRTEVQMTNIYDDLLRIIKMKSMQQENATFAANSSFYCLSIFPSFKHPSYWALPVFSCTLSAFHKKRHLSSTLNNFHPQNKFLLPNFLGKFIETNVWYISIISTAFEHRGTDEISRALSC